MTESTFGDRKREHEELVAKSSKQADKIMSDTEIRRQAQQRMDAKKKKLKESAKPKARWNLTSGPNRVRGYELQTPSKTGGYSNVGFKMTNDKPKTSGSIKLYVGATGKDVEVNLDDYDFGT